MQIPASVLIQLPQRRILQIGNYIKLTYFLLGQPNQVAPPHQQLRMQALARI
jgi:hypothetical protein